jgi:hypothetical protein
MIYQNRVIKKNRRISSRFILFTDRPSVLFRASFCMLTLLFLFSCDENFQPIQENEAYSFSIYGYLDASADTQWVRVTPARNRVDMPPEMPGIHVTLENLQNGNRAVKSDSLFQDPDGFNFLNVWTTMEIEPSQTYRLTAEHPERGTSRVTVTTPEDFPTPVIDEIGTGCRGTMWIEGIERDRLADIQSIWRVRLSYFSGGRLIADDVEERTFSIPYRSRVYSQEPELHNLFLDTIQEQDQIFDQLTVPPGTRVGFQVLSREIFVAAGGPEWTGEIESMNDLVYALPGSLSNVENGLGYMLGIVSKTIWWESCFQ